MKNIVALLALFLPFISFCQQPHQPTLDELIPKNRQQEMGLHKLSSEEKEALRQHIVALLTAASLANHASDSGSVTRSSSSLRDKEPSATSSEPALYPAQRRANRAATVYPSTTGGHWIKQNIGRGEFIQLEDRSLWQVDPLDKIDASLWLPISSITVIESSNGSPGYDYLLINTDDKEKAHAKYVETQ